MLKVDISWETSHSLASEAVVLIGNVGHGTVTDYAIKVGSDRSPTAGFLRSYPRWGEPLLGLVARALEVGRENIEQRLIAEDSHRLSCRTSLVSYGVGRPRLLEELLVERSGATYLANSKDADGNEQHRQFASTASSAVIVLIEAICEVLWHAPQLPPLPPPLRLPIRSNGVDYVRFADVPTWALAAFKKYTGGRRCPPIQGEAGACAYALDWLAFLG